ncbi:succinate dehydrogenase, hydrophobic membrane anchor protein [Arenibaculum pallidiluteum]|uniref:succinate dehydrogenase, hydrophobic membrane anchor protein n=1 Tax=Arenibaculum pallidiluteum TaxID=2812559 RepID=UPI001A95DE36|nr:succinate dehydrogenase, hydrophobic membrane anchor protein [Arenibaculum pallidiluteum]
MNSFRTPLGRVRGLGTANAGTQHWWQERVTSVALVPLTLWFVIAVIGLIGQPWEAVALWLSSPLSAVLAVLFVVVSFYHAALGLQVVIEDYVHSEGAKVALLLAVKFLCVLLGTAGVFSVLKIAFGG